MRGLSIVLLAMSVVYFWLAVFFLTASVRNQGWEDILDGIELASQFLLFKVLVK